MGTCRKISEGQCERRRRIAADYAAAGNLNALAASRITWCCTASDQGTICPWLVKGPGAALVKCAGGEAGPREFMDLYGTIRQADARCPQDVW
ncbi:MAG: hypothetical protein NTU93_07935 [Arthrobacter sp.]|nr:hypothetical protein [Arthrobacter sp.]